MDFHIGNTSKMACLFFKEKKSGYCIKTLSGIVTKLKKHSTFSNETLYTCSKEQYTCLIYKVT